MTPIVLGEFVGTFFLTLLGCGVVANCVLAKSKGKDAGWLTIATGWAIAVMIGVFAAQSAGSEGADINPAVSLAKLLFQHTYTPQLFCQIVIAQLSGAFLGAVFVFAAYYAHWQETSDADTKRAVFCTSPAIPNFGASFITEVIGTACLVLGIGAIFGEATHQALPPGLAPYFVGMLVWGIGLSLGGPTGYAINPARDLGPRLAYAVLPIAGKGKAGWDYAWIPVLGPIAGAIAGTALSALFF